MLLGRIFSRRVSYAAHALCLLVRRQPLEAIPFTELAIEMARAWPGTSATYLSKVVQALVQGGILVSLRGPAGGYGLARPPAGLSLLDIVRALELPFDRGCPLTPVGPCTLRERCGNFHVLLQLQNDVSKLLAGVTIEQLASNLAHPQTVTGQQASCVCPSALPIATGRATTFQPPLPHSRICPPLVHAATS